VSGQVPADKNLQIVPGGIQEHTVRLHYLYQWVHWSMECTNANDRPLSQEQCIKNITNVLEAAGSSLDKVVKFNVYLKNMDDFAAMNEVYAKVCTAAISIEQERVH
jgi:hypothetical protein